MANEMAEVRPAMVAARQWESAPASAGDGAGDGAHKCACPRIKKPIIPIARAAAARTMDSRRPRNAGV